MHGAQNLLATQEVRDVYANFTQWGNESGRASKLAAGASRYLQFLAKMDVALEQRAVPLDGALIVQIFSTEELRRMGLLSQYLAEAGLLNDDAATRRRHSEERLLSTKRDAITGQPWAEDIDRFERALLAREPIVSLRSRRGYVHAAVALLTQAKVARATQVGQKALDSFVAKKPGLKASLSTFVSHLNGLHGLRLKLKPKSATPVSLVRQAQYVRTICDAIESSPNRPARLALTAKLLSKLLNAPLDRILQLRHSDLDLKDFRNLRLDGEWLELPEVLLPILASLPSPQWRAGLDADPLLFAGRMLMDSLSASAVDHHVKPVLRARLGA
ncbi:MAG: hypothetical protein HYX47_05075 [Burkholderiales bacterium]|nr:hypothetical protein [Burkholderiales bacterium]